MSKKDSDSKVSISIEYRAPHWMILVRNPGQTSWEPVRSTTKKVRIHDEFGNEIKSYPAIESFPSQMAAAAWLQANVDEYQHAARKGTWLKSWFSFNENVNVAEKYKATLSATT